MGAPVDRNPQEGTGDAGRAPNSSLSEPIRPSTNPRLAGGEVCLLEKTMNDLRMELKVCEGCGALWLRAGCSGAGESLRAPANTSADAVRAVYCRSCVRVLASFPAPRGPKKASRTRVRVRRPMTVMPVAAMQGGAR